MELKFYNDEWKSEENKASCVVYIDDMDSNICEREFTYVESLEKVKQRLVDLIADSKNIIKEIDEEIGYRQ